MTAVLSRDVDRTNVGSIRASHNPIRFFKWRIKFSPALLFAFLEFGTVEVEHLPEHTCWNSKLANTARRRHNFRTQNFMDQQVRGRF